MCFSRTETADKVVQTCPPKTENIIIIGSEQYYDSFWWKMMFITPGFSIAAGMKHPPYWQAADKTTVLYVPDGYVKAELLPIEFLKDRLEVNVQMISSISDLISYLNNRNADGAEYKVRHLLFMAHGLHDKIALNFWERPNIDIKSKQISAIKSDIFVPKGHIYSYACRTGISVDGKEFDNLEEAKPENSLAQKMADHFGVKVHAYYTRTLFRSCIRDPADSNSISKSLKQKRENHIDHPGHPTATVRIPPKWEIIQISDEHEGLPHPGQGLTHEFSKIGLSGIRGDIPFIPSGQQKYGTSEYSLWRKAGARHLPVGDNTPAGLPNTMQVFEPK